MPAARRARYHACLKGAGMPFPGAVVEERLPGPQLRHEIENAQEFRAVAYHLTIARLPPA